MTLVNLLFTALLLLSGLLAPLLVMILGNHPWCAVQTQAIPSRYSLSQLGKLGNFSWMASEWQIKNSDPLAFGSAAGYITLPLIENNTLIPNAIMSWEESEDTNKAHCSFPESNSSHAVFRHRRQRDQQYHCLENPEGNVVGGMPFKCFPIDDCYLSQFAGPEQRPRR
ncbi:hypothetical protein HYDPIDRAFT_108484 [Hydnomerulius pinastri MD-312]|nr:hypothetical protein HYDPIDRAFT_108484 [Hydnomerulius pinastri MD-312]